MGLPLHHSLLCGDYAGAIEACDRADNVIQTLPAWRAAALFELGQPELGTTHPK